MRQLLCALFLLLVSGTAHGYSSVTVPLGDPSYRQLDKLASFGLVKTMMQGQRPYVRFEIARLIQEAMDNYDAFEAKYRDNPELDVKASGKWLKAKVHVDDLLKDLKRRFAAELIQRKALPGDVPRYQGRLIDSVSFDFLYLDEPKETIIPYNGLGGVNATLQPLVDYREGRHYQEGYNFAFETQHWMRLGKYFSLQAQPRFQMQVATDNLTSENEVFVQRLNGRFTWNKLDIQIGRDSVNWGPSANGGLTFSNNARPLDMIKVSSISPFYYPFFFRKLGQNEMSLVVANLGPDQVFKDSWLVAYKISNRRNPYFEFGFTQTLILGGEGSPPLGVLPVLSEFFDITSNNTRSLRNVAIELIGRVPQARGMEIYTELNFADFSSNMETMWFDNTSYLAGLYLPRLNFSGTWDLRAEYRRLAPRYSRGLVFTDGMTQNQLLLGDPLGPDSWLVSLASLYELNTENWLTFGFQFSRRHDNYYKFNAGSVTTLFDGGSENRFLYQVGWRRWLRPYLEGRVAVGLEHVQNPDFVDGSNRFNWTGQMGLTYYFPDRWVDPGQWSKKPGTTGESSPSP